MSEDVGNDGMPVVAGAMENLERQILLVFPWFFLVQRVIKKYSSFYTRALLLTFGTGIFLSRQLKGYLGNIVREYMMSRAEVTEGDEAYLMLLSWISQQKFSNSARNFMATLEKDRRSINTWNMSARARANLEDASKAEPLKYTPSRGMYPFWYKGSLFFFERGVENTISALKTELLSISRFGRNPQSIKKLLEECREEFNKKDEGQTVIYNPDLRYSSEGTWVRAMSRTKRDIDTVVLDPEIKNSVIKDLENYFDPKQRLWYSARGIPYRRGYLLYGPPGTGKSSLSIAIAGHFNLKMYVVNLNASRMDETILMQLFSLLPSKCIVLMEDIDAAGLTHQRSGQSQSYHREKPQITLSGLLNAIDGVASQEGRVLIMTTNHVLQLDAALIRPGRVDMMIEFSKATKAQLVQIFRGIYGKTDFSENQSDELSGSMPCLLPICAEKFEAEKATLRKAHIERISLLGEEFAENIPNETFTPAEIQGYLLKHKNDPELATEKASAWAADTIAAKAAAAAAAAAEQKELEAEEEAKDGRKLYGKKLMRQNQAINQLILTHANLEEKKAEMSLKSGAENQSPHEKSENENYLGTNGESSARDAENNAENGLGNQSPPIIDGETDGVSVEKSSLTSGSSNSDTTSTDNRDS